MLSTDPEVKMTKDEKLKLLSGLNVYLIIGLLVQLARIIIM